MSKLPNFPVDLRELLVRKTLTPADLNAIQKRCIRSQSDFSELVLSLFTAAKPGDVLSRVGLPVWRGLLSAIRDRLAQASDKQILHLLRSTRLDRTKIRDSDVGNWLGLLLETQVVPAFSRLDPSQHGGDLAEWVTQTATKTKDAGPLVEVLSSLAGVLQCPSRPIEIGYVYRDMVFVDIRLVECCLQLKVPFRHPAGHLVLKERWWLAAAKELSSGHSGLSATLSHAEYGPMTRRKLISLLRVSSVDDLTLDRIQQHHEVRAVFADYLEGRIDALVRGGLRRTRDIGGDLMGRSCSQVLRSNPRLVRKLGELRLEKLLQRALRAGVLDEIGWKAFDEAVERYNLPSQHGIWDRSYFFTFPYVSCVQDAVIITCGPRSVATRPLPKKIPVAGIRSIVPVGDDCLLIYHPQGDRVPPSTWGVLHAKWLSNFKNSKPLVGPADIAECATLLDLGDGRFSISGKPFRAGELPVGYPFSHVYCEGNKVWRLVSPLITIGQSIDPTSIVTSCLQGWDCRAGKKLQGTMPDFFASRLLPGGQPLLDASYCVPQPRELTDTRSGAVGQMLGFFTQGMPDGTAHGIGIDGRQACRRVEENSHGALRCDIPLAMLDKPGTGGFWTVVRRQNWVHVIDEASGEEIASNDPNVCDMPGQACAPPLPLFWSLYSVRCETTSRQLRKISLAATRRLLDAGRREPPSQDRNDVSCFGADEFPCLRQAISQEFPHAPENLARGIASACWYAVELGRVVDAALNGDATIKPH